MICYDEAECKKILQRCTMFLGDMPHSAIE